MIMIIVILLYHFFGINQSNEINKAEAFPLSVHLKTHNTTMFSEQDL